jgi:hypothetical protein
MADYTNFAELIAKYNLSLPTLSDGEASPLQVSSDGHLLVTFSNTTIGVTGTFWQAVQPVNDNSGSLTVDNNGTFAVQAACTGTFWPLSYFAVDVAAGAADLGVHVLTVRDDALSTLTEADGDYSRLRVNSTGALWVAGSVTVTNLPGGGTEADKGSDETGDGLVSLTAGPDELVSIAVASGSTLKVYGWSWSSDKQCTFRLEVYDALVLVKIIRVVLNSGSIPADSMVFGNSIDIAGAANRVVRVRATKVGGGAGGSASAGINAELV